MKNTTAISQPTLHAMKHKQAYYRIDIHGQQNVMCLPTGSRPREHMHAFAGRRHKQRNVDLQMQANPWSCTTYGIPHKEFVSMHPYGSIQHQQLLLAPALQAALTWSCHAHKRSLDSYSFCSMHMLESDSVFAHEKPEGHSHHQQAMCCDQMQLQIICKMRHSEDNLVLHGDHLQLNPCRVMSCVAHAGKIWQQ